MDAIVAHAQAFLDGLLGKPAPAPEPVEEPRDIEVPEGLLAYPVDEEAVKTVLQVGAQPGQTQSSNHAGCSEHTQRT